MNDYVTIISSGDSISLAFYIEEDKVMEIGEKLAEINESAYMNGYNWDALLNCYLDHYAPELLGELESDPEAGMYAAYFEASPDGESAAQSLRDTIISLIEHEEVLYDFVRNYGDEIEWD